ncbi:MAG: hypothetical protein HQK77_05425 [Desulfobacterales bacterium]|nr:hypothetical protein [Desulfobacterales bacterium]
MRAHLNRIHNNISPTYLMGKRFTSYMWKFLFIIIILFFKSVCSYAADPDTKIMIFFFSSETNINNFKSLKTEFDKYITALGPYEFQPFSDRIIFEEHIKTKKNYLLFLSSWHYQKIYKSYLLSPVLVGSKNNTATQKRAIVVKAGTSLSNAIRFHDIEPIASASSVEHTYHYLIDIIKDEQSLESTRIIAVPKDIDALMAVGFGMSKSALVTAYSLNTLKTVNPFLFNSLKILTEGKESLLLIAAVPKPFAHQSEQAIYIIQQMAADPNGVKILKMFNIEGWKQIEATDISKLEG